MNINDLETNKETKTDILILRITPSEKYQLLKIAQKMGVSASAFVRYMLASFKKENER